jgi:hypothetical protein
MITCGWSWIDLLDLLVPTRSVGTRREEGGERRRAR